MTKNTRKGHGLNAGDTFTWGGTGSEPHNVQQATVVRFADRSRATVVRLADGREFEVQPAKRFFA